MTELVADDFERADGALGANWSTVVGQIAPEIFSGEVRSSTVGTAAARQIGYGAWPDNQYAEAIVGSVVHTGTDEGAGVTARCSAVAKTHYLVQTNSVETRLYRTLNGAYLQLGTDGPPCTTGDVLRLICNGNQISVTKNGATIIGPVTNSDITAGSPGTWNTGAAAAGTIASWAGGDLTGDTTAPTLSSPTGAATGDTTADGSVSTDEGNGTLFAVVTTSATAPTAAQVKAGQDHTGAAAAFAVGSGSGQAVTGTGTQNVSATGLTASTAYYWHYMHEDAATNQSTVVSSASFTTTGAASVTLTALKDEAGNLLASTTIYWSWFPGGTKRIGALGATPEEGSDTTDANGDITIAPTTAGVGVLLWSYRPGAISLDQCGYAGQVTVA